MKDTATSIDQDTAALIEQTVREAMQPFGLTAVEVRAGEDHDGDPVIYIEAQYEFSERPVNSSVTAKLTTTLRDRLWERGETRFPHVRHRFHERQKVAGYP